MHRRRTFKTIAYRLLAMLLVLSIYGANMTALTYASVNSASSEEETYCGLAEHTHAYETCYEELRTLTCGIEEGDVHAHEEACFEEQKVLICETAEQIAHTHDDSCKQIQKKLTCETAEQEAHAHEESCYTVEETLSCGMTEQEPHAHSDACRTDRQEFVCALTEGETHVHGEGCFEIQRTLLCPEAEIFGHTHEDGCYTDVETVICVLAEDENHTHGAECRTIDRMLTCGREEYPGHVHGDTCYMENEILTCVLNTEEVHTHGDGCYVTVQDVTCGLEETEGHVHGAECYTETKSCTCSLVEGDGHAHGELCYADEEMIACGLEETEGHAHGEECYAMQTVRVCAREEGVPHAHGDACCVTEIRMTCEQEEHTHTDECYGSLKLIERTITDERGLASVTGILPENAELRVRELTEEEIAALEVPVEQLLFAYDITIWVDGEEYQPEEPVQVTVLPQTQPEQAVETVSVQHIEVDEETSEISVTEVSNTANELTGEVTFSAESFSIYIGTVVTPEAKILLIPDTGFSFYQGSNLVTGRLEWKNAMTLTVRPEPSYKITAITVEEGENTSDDVTITAPTGAGKDWTLTFSAPGEGEADQKIVVTAALNDGISTVYLDLALGNIEIKNTTYTGSYTDITGGTVTTVNKSGASYDPSTTRFHIYQSTETNRATSGVIDGVFVAPEYAAVTVDGKPWREYITNNTDALAIYQAWHGTDSSRTGSLFSDRAPTANGITIAVTGQDCDVTLENIWSTKQPSSNQDATSSIYISGCSTANTRVVLRLKGDSKLGRLHYTCNSANGSSMTITDVEGAGAVNNSLVVVGDPAQAVGNDAYQGQVARNTWQAVIGASDSTKVAYGIVINGGTVYAGSATDWENCSAIGGGGNRMGQVTINGGNVTAVARTTGTAIGGGIGHQSQGGEGLVTINAGNVYAYNYGVRAYHTVKNYGTSDPETLRQASHIPGTAIGGASSILQPGAKGTVTINGGYVYAESLGGAALGGGNSVTKGAGEAVITINGGTVDAKSVGQIDYTNGAVEGYDVEPGVAIGGGTAGLGSGIAANGGYAKVNINGGTIRTGSIGGGGTNDKDAENPGKIGYADVTITGGDISGQIIMAGDVDACKFTMTGGVLHDSNVEDTEFPRLQKNGGAVYMDDTKGEAKVSGGTIENCRAENGGAVYMTAGTFELSGDGKIQNCVATDNTEGTAGNGGAVYMGGGTLSVSGGSMNNNTAPNNGGAIYMGGGELHISGGSLTYNTATSGNGGAAYIENGSVVMSGGKVDNNSAANGGAMYVSVMEENANVGIKIFSGSISNNSASGSGGALAVVGNPSVTNQDIAIILGAEELHEDDNGNTRLPFAHTDNGITYTHESCPVINNNSVGTGGTGGAIYLNGGSDATKTRLNVYCLEADGNADGTKERRSDFMMVEGGKLIISSAVYETDDTTANQDSKQGSVNVRGSLHVTGGQVDLYGGIQNPAFLDRITVDVDGTEAEYFKDHRYVEGDIRTITYFENFQGSGRYTVYHKQVGVEHTVESSMYSHEGYQLLYWYTKSSTAEEGCKYQANDPYTLNGTNEPVGVDAQGNLTLYGIWEATGYWIKFHSNAPVNVPVSGSMELQHFKYDTLQNLTENAFACPGYIFLGWHTDPNATEALYTDKQEVGNLTLENNAVIDLYAVWKLCDHTETERYSYSVIPESDKRQTLQRSCSCGAKVWERVLSASDVTYDEKPHGVTLTSASGWEDDFTIVYYNVTTDGKEEKEETEPVNAGKYRATVTLPWPQTGLPEGEGSASLTATVVYEILKATQAAPPKPTFTVVEKDGKTYLKVNKVDPGKTPTKYRLAYKKDGQDMAGAWIGEQDKEFAEGLELPETFTYYWVEAYYEEGENYLESEASRSSSGYPFSRQISAVLSADPSLITT